MLRADRIATFLAALSITTAALAQDSALLPTGTPHAFNTEEAAAERLTFLRGKLDLLQIKSAEKDDTLYTLNPTQTLRWSNPVTGTIDGGIFIWTDGERPVVIAKSFLNERWGNWTACVQSVADRPLVVTESGRTVWEPQPDVKFVLLEDERPDPKMAETQRLVRMRAIVRQVQITSIYGEDTQTPWELRMLTAPVLRYSSPSRGIADGAAFAFTQGGTNPEAVALIEFRDKAGVRSCHLAIARLSTYAHTARFKDKTISDVPRLVRFPTGEMKRSFYATRQIFSEYPFAKSSDSPVP